MPGVGVAGYAAVDKLPVGGRSGRIGGSQGSLIGRSSACLPLWRMYRAGNHRC